MRIKNFFKNNLIISSLIILSLIIIINNFYRFFQNNSAYEFDNWLINYQGGFVRRGLSGEFFFQVHELLNIHLGWLVFVSISFFYFLFYFIFFKLISKIKINNIFIFAICSPLAFYFPVLNSKATGQKEILFFVSLALLCLILPKLKKIQATYFIIFLILVTGLTHEGLAFYSLYLIIPYLLNFNSKNFKELSLCFVPFFLTIIILLGSTFYFHGSEQKVVDICNSVKNYVNPNCLGKGIPNSGISNLAGSFEDYQLMKKTAGMYKGEYGLPLFPRYFMIYGFGFLLGFLPLLILFKKAKFVNHINFLSKLNPLFIFILLMLSTAPIYYAGLDWGRYLNISYICSFIILIFSLGNNILKIEEDIFFNSVKKINFFLLIIVIIIYSFSWTVPICCELSFKSGIVRSFNKVIYYYNRDF